MSAERPDFTKVTELPGVRETRANLIQLYTRYHWASRHVVGKRVLELGCGAGVGLGYMLNKGAAIVVGGDIEERNLNLARQHYTGRSRLELAIMDAQSIPRSDSSYDVVILFEAVYFIPDAGKFLAEAFRVLAPGGLVLISTVNREWPQFNPAPFSFWYPSARELKGRMEQAGFRTVIRGAFPDGPANVHGRMVAWTRRVAARMKLIPDSMKGKELLKRVFYGRLEPIPSELVDGCYDPEPLTEIDADQSQPLYMFLFAEGRKA